MLKLKRLYIHPFAFITQLAFWIVAISFMLFTSLMNYGWEQGSVRAVLIFLCHFFNFYAFYWWLAPKYFEKKNYFFTIVLGIIILAALVPVRMAIEEGFSPAKNSVALFLLGKKAIIYLIVFSEILIACFATLLKQAVHNEEKKHKIAILNQLNLETELSFLKAQISPHFLFNSLNNIYSLTLTKSHLAPDSLLKLSSLLRYCLYETNQPVFLEKEIEVVNNYKELFQLRYPESLNFKLVLDETYKGLKIEPLLILPIIENAFKHSAIGLESDAFIFCKISRCDNSILIETGNSKHKRQVDTENGGIGLHNIRKRLALVYPDNHELKIIDNPNNFIVILKIPMYS